MTAKMLLIKAYAILDSVGWCQNDVVQFKDGLPCAYCLSGAIRKAYNELYPGEHQIIGQAKSAVEDVINTKFPTATDESLLLIIHFNDTAQRTKQEVLEVLDTAISTLQ